jgi:hypothetical protein
LSALLRSDGTSCTLACGPTLGSRSSEVEAQKVISSPTLCADTRLASRSAESNSLCPSWLQYSSRGLHPCTVVAKRVSRMQCPGPVRSWNFTWLLAAPEVGEKPKTDACTRRCGVARPKGPAKIGIDRTSSFLHGKGVQCCSVQRVPERFTATALHSSLKMMLSRLATS